MIGYSVGGFYDLSYAPEEDELGNSEALNPASGLTAEEHVVMDHLAAAWNAFAKFESAISHDDRQDFVTAMHRIQQVFQGRAIRRLYPDYWR